MPDEVTPQRIAALAAAARVRSSEDAPARIARAVTPTVTRYAAENIAIPLETEPSSFLVVQTARTRADERSAEMNLKDLAAAIRRRKVSSVEVTKALLARIEKWQPTLNAFARVEAEDALKSAKAADRALAAGKAKGPLHGVPLAHKDMYYSKGKLAECGSKIRKGWIPQATATAVERLEAAGTFRLGAVNMVEFAYGPTGHNVHTGNVCNPWSPDSHHRRLVVGLRLGGRGAAGAGRARLRHRRLDPHAGAFLWRQRVQADQQPRQPRQRDAALVHARHGRAAGADRRGLRDHPFDHRRAGSARSDHCAGAEVGRERDAAAREGPDHRHSKELLCRRPRTGRRQGARRRDRGFQAARRQGGAGRSAGPGDGLGRRA